MSKWYVSLLSPTFTLLSLLDRMSAGGVREGGRGQ